MNGILSPDKEKVMHNGEWIDAVLSPDGDAYHLNGDWYPLTNFGSQPSQPNISQGRMTKQKKVKVATKAETTNIDGKTLIIMIVAIGFLMMPRGILGISIIEQAATDCGEIGADEYTSSFDIEMHELCEEVKAGAMTQCLSVLGIALFVAIIFNKASSPENQTKKLRKKK